MFTTLHNLILKMSLPLRRTDSSSSQASSSAMCDVAYDTPAGPALPSTEPERLCWVVLQDKNLERRLFDFMSRAHYPSDWCGPVFFEGQIFIVELRDELYESEDEEL